MSADYSDEDKLAILENPDDPRHAGLLDFLDSTSDVNAPDENAPFGYMIDPNTGERRPKKRPGRQRVAKAAPVEDAADEGPVSFEDRAPIEREADRAPADRGRRGRKAKAEKPVDNATVPMPKPGVIARGVNKLYVKAGKLIRVMDAEVGYAVISIARKDSEDDVTVGEAWEELAKVNPRIRAVLLRLITGGAWGQLLMCHMPILLAILMKDGIRQRIPFMDFAVSFMGNDEDVEEDFADSDEVPAGLAGLMQGMTQEDLAQAMAFAQQMMPGVRPPSTGRGQ